MDRLEVGFGVGDVDLAAGEDDGQGVEVQVPAGGDREEAGWVELADGAVQGGRVAVLVGVQPAQREPAPVDQVEVGVAPPLPELGGVGQGLPDPLDRVGEAADEADLGGEPSGPCSTVPSAIGRSSGMALLSRLLQVAFEGVEALAPEPPIRLQPLVELVQGLGAQGIEAPLGVDPDPDEPGITQHPQVLRLSPGG